jgi:uncharacterized protein (UPF0548 family)
MLLLRRPSDVRIQQFIDSKAASFSYSHVGATASSPPPGYVVDHTRVLLGTGKEVFDKAATALRRWEHFRLGWVELHNSDTPIEPGKTVAVMAHVFGLWTMNACRIVYVVDEQEKFGFAYGTLPEHAESSEERFTVEWHQKDDSVWYDILAFSRPNQLLVRLGYPVVRRLQRRFARDSAAAMVRAVVDPMKPEG